MESLELENWQKDLLFLLQTTFCVDTKECHPGHQVLIQDGEPQAVIRFDTKSYPWILFNQFVLELPQHIKVSVNQRVEVNEFQINCSEIGKPVSANFSSDIVTSFLFYSTES